MTENLNNYTDPLPVLQNEERLFFLEQLALLDSDAEEAFDRLTRLASTIVETPVSLISILDKDRQFFKSSVGLDEPWSTNRETPLSYSFCQHVVANGQPLIIEDARQHPLVKDNLAISELNVIAYLGMPLISSEGHRLGSLCVIDDKPRQWLEKDINILQDLAISVLTEIELRQESIRTKNIKQNAQILLEVSRLLISSSPDKCSWSEVAEQIVPNWGDLMIVYLRDEDENGRFYLHTSNKIQPTLAEQWQQYLAQVPLPIISPLLASSNNFVGCHANAFDLSALAQDKEHEALLLATNIAGFISLPLHVEENKIGTLCLLSKTFYKADILPVIEELACLLSFKLHSISLYLNMQDALGKRDRFLMTAAHELKTPITIVSSYSELIYDHLHDEGEVLMLPTLQKQSRVLLNHTRQLAQISHTLLDTNQLQKSDITLHKKPINLVTFVQEQIAEHQLLNPLYMFHFHSTRTLLAIYADPIRLKQIITNVLHNAVKYSPINSPIYVFIDSDDQNAILTVRDEGIGIPKEALAKLGQRFFRASNVASAHGLGLGLHLVYALIEKHDGKIKIASMVGQGTAVNIYLPLYDDMLNAHHILFLED